MKRLLGVLVALAGCEDNSGLVSVTLTTAPGSHVLDDVQTLHVTNTKPLEVHDVSRTSGGFDLSLDFEPTGEATALLIDGRDASGTVIAAGASPPFILGPSDGDIAIYMAAPNSVAASPVMLDPPRSELGVGKLSYGALLAGGRNGSTSAVDALEIYNAFDHSTVKGLALPAPRSSVIVGIGANGIAYLFGGIDESGMATGTLWRFDTTIAPAGQYIDFGPKSGFERAGELAVPIGNEHFLVTGSPVADLYGLGGAIAAKTDLASLPPVGAGLLGTDGVDAAVFADFNGVVRYHAGAFNTVDAPAGPRNGGSVVALPDGHAVIVCGSALGAGLTEAVRIDVASGTAQSFSNVPAQPRTACAATATSRYLVIAGGVLDSGVAATTAEIFDAITLAPVATTPLVVPRMGAQAIPLPNGQVLIAGGVDMNGAPIATLELFTPAN
ncbi:MAG TPA: kelch repeat-containing protein [Kofleriaceae bacterium]|jgi:hypothetical protein|nr:kelch repeat-containing protein [Kofleriaceae bacterium]